MHQMYKELSGFLHKYIANEQGEIVGLIISISETEFNVSSVIK